MTMMMSVLEYSEYSSAGKVSNAKATNQGAGISYDGDDGDDDDNATDADDDDTNADADEEMDDCLMKVNTGVSSITLSAFRSPKFDIPLKKSSIC